MLYWIGSYFVHVLSWFLISYLATVIKGERDAMTIGNASTVGFFSFLLHFLIVKLYF